MPAGRPVKSRIRENIIEILHFLGEGYAYDIYRIYVKIFPGVSVRSIYYHLKKGVVLKEFVVKQVRQVKGDYSWGDSAEKVYYSLGPAANPKLVSVVRKYFEKRKR